MTILKEDYILTYVGLYVPTRFESSALKASEPFRALGVRLRVKVLGFRVYNLGRTKVVCTETFTLRVEGPKCDGVPNSMQVRGLGP